MDGAANPVASFDLIKPILFGVAGPMLAGGLALLVAWGPRRPDATRSRLWAGGPALGAAYALGHAAILGLPASPPLLGKWWNYSAEGWVFHLALLAAIASLIDDLLPPSRLRRLTISGVTAALAVPLIAASTLKYNWSAGQAVGWVPGLIAALLLLIVSMDQAGRRSPGPMLPICWMLLLTGLSVTLVLSRTASGAQLAGGMAAAMGAAFLVALWRRELSLAGGAARVLAVAYGGLLIFGGLYVPNMPKAGAAVLAAAPAFVLLGTAPPFRSLTVRGVNMFMPLAALACAAAAVSLAAVANAAADSVYDGY